jgi:hypothetical protein
LSGRERIAKLQKNLARQGITMDIAKSGEFLNRYL